MEKLGRGAPDVEMRKGVVVGSAVEMLGLEDDAVAVEDEGVHGGSGGRGGEVGGQGGSPPAQERERRSAVEVLELQGW